MAGFQFPVDDLLLLLLVAVPRVSTAIRSLASGCTECSVVFKSGVIWKFSRILPPQCFSCTWAGEICQKAKPNILMDFLGPYLHILLKNQGTQSWVGLLKQADTIIPGFQGCFSGYEFSQLRKSTSELFSEISYRKS